MSDGGTHTGPAPAGRPERSEVRHIERTLAWLQPPGEGRRAGAPAAPLGQPARAASRREGRAFTLIELLVVVAIIALLVTIAMPSLGQAKLLAYRARCAAQMSSHGKALAAYVVASQSYPYYGNAGMSVPGYDWGHERGFTLFHAILQTVGIPSDTRTSFGTQAYIPEADEMWPGAVCPAMDFAAVWLWNERQYALGNFPNPGKAYQQRCSMSYQWNVCLRAATPNRPPSSHCGLIGRWAPSLENLDVHPNGLDGWLVFWTDYVLFPPASNGAFAAQATHPNEIANPARVAQGWDGCDLETAPNLGYVWPVWETENLTPGWHIGPFNRGTGGRALLNAARHGGSPNILYADGHVAADANRRINPDEDLGPCPWGTWEGLKTTTWDDFDADFGTLNHIVPRCEFYNE